MTRLHGLLPFLLCAVIFAAACAPGANRSAPAGPQGDAANGSPPPSSGPKTIRLAVDASSEPSGGMILIGRGGAVGLENYLMFHSALTVYDQDSQLMPRLTERVPTIENGDWKVGQDSSMEVTWHLRQDAKWHDGSPLTADDFVFGNTVRADRAFGIATGPPARLIGAVSAPDAHTLVVRWNQSYVYGNVSGVEDFPALPRHLMESVYQQGDKDSFLASPLWTTGWVGLGPYRISSWSLGSQLEGAAFDGYLLGRPKIDRVIIRYFGDPNSGIAALLSGDVDMAPVGSTYVLDQMVTVKNAWDSSQAGTTMAIARGVRNLKLQFRDPNAPWARDPSVRRGLAYATDRQAVVDTLLFGLTTPAYTWVTTDDPVYALLQQRGFTQYTYDPTQAARLFADAGWVKGSDGIYQRGGQRFQIDVSAQNRASFPQEAAALAGQWSQLGLASAPALIQSNATNREELTSTYQGAISWPGTFRDGAIRDWASEQISTADTRWRGSNFGAYSNPQIDQLFDRFQNSLQIPQQEQVIADALKVANDDLPFIPMYIYTASVMFRKGVTGPGKVSPNQLASAWNAHLWEIN